MIVSYIGNFDLLAGSLSALPLGLDSIQQTPIIETSAPAPAARCPDAGSRAAVEGGRRAGWRGANLLRAREWVYRGIPLGVGVGGRALRVIGRGWEERGRVGHACRLGDVGGRGARG